MQPDHSVNDYVATLDEQTAKDTQELIQIMRRISGHEPKLWNVGTIGFDTYHYKYDSGREGDMMIVGFSPRKAATVLYGVAGSSDAKTLAKLGKHTKGKGCLYIKKLADVDQKVLEAMVVKAVAGTRARLKTT